MRDRDDILSRIRSHKEELRRDFGVETIALFGSVARGGPRASSDVDILVGIERDVSLFDLVRLQKHLEQILEVRRVDLVLRDSIFPEIREDILSEAVDVA